MRTTHSKFKGDAEIIVFKIYLKTIELGDDSVGTVLVFSPMNPWPG